MSLTLETQTLISKEWPAIPGKVLFFPFRLGLSSDMQLERQAAIGAGIKERAEMLLQFRTKLISDVLAFDPYMVDIDETRKAYQAGLADRLKGITNKKEIARITEGYKLTIEETAKLKTALPGYPDISDENPKTIAERAFEYFSQEVEGRRIFGPLIEELAEEYWLWATPRPTISVLGLMQG